MSITITDLEISDLTSNVTTDENFVVTGDGVFDILMATANQHINAQYNAERITQKDYATVYLGAFQNTLTEAVRFLLGKDIATLQAEKLAADITITGLEGERIAEETDLLQTQDSELKLNGVIDRVNKGLEGIVLTNEGVLKENQGELVEKQAITEDKKALLVARQTKGFDDDAIQKLLKQTLDSWSVAYSVAKDANSVPDTIKVDSIDSVMKGAMAGLGLTVKSNPLGIS